MLNDKSIIAAMISSRALYENIKAVLTDDDLSLQAQPVVAEIDEYYTADPSADSVDKELLCSSLLKRYPKHGKEFEAVIRELPAVESPTNFLKFLREYKQHNIGVELAGLLLNPKSSPDKIKYMLDQYSNFDQEAPDSSGVVGRSIVDLAKAFAPSGLNRLYPRSLNEAVGGGVPDHTHVGIIARPETGKTAFGISNACGYAKNGHKVLYIGNEDPIDSYLFRIVSRLTERARKNIIDDPQAAAELAEKSGYNNIIFDDEVPCTFPRIEKLINKHQPKLVIIDQLHQVYIPKVDGSAEQLTKATREARRLCKKYPIIIISFTQAGDSGNNKLVLGMGDTYQSNTSFPGDVDIFIGLGTNEAYSASNRRMINLAKNKINGNHINFPVLLDPSLSKVISV